LSSIAIAIAIAIAMTLGVSTPAAASPSLLVALPSLSALSIEASGWIGDELRALHRVFTQLPRLVRAEPRASVTAVEAANHIIVAASRLPPGGKRSKTTSEVLRGN
jgi:hypothetical protein